MIEYIRGDIFNSDCDILVHQVNCKGKMGKGIAYDIRNKYPYVYTSYKEFCKDSNNLGGKLHIVVVNHHISGKALYIVNLFGQDGYGHDKRYTNYEWVENGIKLLAEYAKRHNLSIAIPYKMGCNNAGGNWEKIYQIIYNYLGNNNTICRIYKK